MKNWTKVAATAAAVGALGVAGSFGTFSAFTDAEVKDISVSAGTLQVTNTFALPSLTNFGTRDTTYVCNGTTGLPVAGGTSECHDGPAGKRAGSVTIKNTGSLDQDVYLDFDGPGVADCASPNSEPCNPIANNVILDTSFSEDFSTPGYRAFRIWRFNAAGQTKWFTLAPEESRTIYFRAWLRERKEGEYVNGDNEMQGVTIDNQKLTVTGIEAGRTDGISTTPDNGV